MRIQQLYYIIKIAETGSMNEAAKQLFITREFDSLNDTKVL
jgi:DNA-binding transcriptional LysR family regulator